MRRRTHGEGPKADELAAILLTLGLRGIEQRARGRCLGIALGRTVTASGGDVHVRVPPTIRAQRKLVRLSTYHARQGHAEGCEEFGLAVPEVERVIGRYDRCGAAEFLLDTYREAVAVMRHALASDGRWCEAEASEVLETAIRKRITPRPTLAATALSLR